MENYDKLFKNMKTIYNKLEDEISKELFISRLNFSATGEESFIHKIKMQHRNLSADVEMFYQKLCDPRKKVIFGAGNFGTTIASTFVDLDFKCFIDNYPKTEIEPKTKLPIFTLAQYKEKYDISDTLFVVAIVNGKVARAVFDQLTEAGAKEKNIILLSTGDYRNNTSQYFDVFAPGENEVFVDCGCFDGSSAFGFAGWCGAKKYKKIYCFEPDPQLYKSCKSILENLNNCELYEYGVSNQNGEVSFLANAQEDARIVENVSSADVTTIKTIKLDDIIDDEVTFIKMDIEGEELNALLGAENIIRKNKPKLAICVYHSYSHFVSIPQLLLEFRPDYKFKIRQYSLFPNETVLYAE